MSLRSYIRPGVAALQLYWKPFLLIQVGAMIVVAAYFLSPTVARWCEGLAEINRRGGIWFAAVVSALAGGLLPEVAKLVTGGKRRSDRWVRDTVFNHVFFAVSGAVVYVFYAWQTRLFGDRPDIATLVKKIALDQFGFTVFWATPFGLTAYALHRHHYRLMRAWPDINPVRIVVKAPSLLLPNWAFWIPMVTMVYSLPSALQFPLFACALAAWSLLLVFIASDSTATGEGT